MNRFRALSLLMVPLVALSTMNVALPLTMQDSWDYAKEKALDLKGATWDKATRHVQCFFDFENKHRCSKREKREAGKWIGITAAGTVVTIAGLIGLGLAAKNYFGDNFIYYAVIRYEKAGANYPFEQRIVINSKNLIDMIDKGKSITTEDWDRELPDVIKAKNDIERDGGKITEIKGTRGV